jgi:anti-sigma factor RsiW
MAAEWTDAEIELLSAYIDEQLEPSDRTALEARLAEDADLRRELAAMRQTVALLRDLPTIRAPRAFTLTPDMVGQTAAAAPAELRVLPPPGKARPARRTWWIPAASAAGVVLVAGAFFLTQTNSGSPTSGSVEQVAVLSSPTTITNFSELNTVVQQSATQAVAVGALPPGQSDDDAQEQPRDEQETQDKILPTELLLEQDSSTQVQQPAPIMPPQSQAGNSEPYFQPSPSTEMMDAMIVPQSTQMATASLAPNLDTATGMGGGVLATVAGTNPEMMTGMDGINPNPQAPGFTVATMSPTQGTMVAQYNASEPAAPSILMAVETPLAAESSAAQESPADTTMMRSSNDPIWIRWINTLSEWLQMILSR